ncbi:MAG: RpiB/LacA/LacB family sugar-phosphate isomerase [Miniphocaeibacter sp.]|uniref:RpiB/LacA/LacB family sugar-phosphate isomerase n=1 Tax=Miniphocaeibacter sp. TaxID=3100973 RepID=UPI0018091260|nr:RpiB/LacA/LacB family sugar-phosphate isomerase [Gallicola sp.]
MKIALINENSQAGKNVIIYDELKKTTDKKGYEVINFGMFNNEDPNSLTYVQIGLLSSILLSTKAVDFVVTGCGTGEGACVASNAFPNVVCGHVTNPLDAYLFSQVNGGNAVAIPFAQNYGWGGELNLRYLFEKLFLDEMGGGYPVERREPEQKNAKILDEVKKVTHRPLIDILKNIDKEFLKETIDRPSFKEYFFENSKDEEISNYLKEIIS